MDFGGKGVGRRRGRRRTLGFLRRGQGAGFGKEGGHSIGEAEALGELGVEESPQIEDVASPASIARGAKRLKVSLGASCLLDFSALRLAGTLVSAAPWGLGAGESFWAFVPLGGAQPGGHVARHSSAVSGLPWSYTPSRGCGTSTGIDPSPIHRKMTSQLGSVGQRCPPVSGERSGHGGMLMSDSHYCRAVTTSTSRIHPSPHTGRTSWQTRRPHCGDSTWEEKEVEDSRRRSRRDDSAGKQVGTEDKSQVEKEMSLCPEREAVHRRQPALVASYDPRLSQWSQFFPGPHTGHEQ
ncbi:hypothetical protein PoB_003106500 [Plakobranchus ocellatus]|uniref:Uncharacterized protein n=1 Tax=Plakobranchus ocellatus TaxID=259542 RepID=A0AAV4ACL6_9GAST|nr:hypothetical protein PoB_003106500 [Plakobranchus ocellatus]